MGLIEKLTNIANGFRASRGTTTKYTLDEMAILAAEPVGGGGGSADPVLQKGEATPTKAVQKFTPGTGYDGFSEFTVKAIPDEYVIPQGEVTITENGEHNVAGKAVAKVSVPIPDGYIKPSGELEISENGVYDVRDKETADVHIPDPVVIGLNVTENGTYEPPDGMVGFNPVTVNVPIPDGYIKPSGSLTITENGTHDVTTVASVEVSVESSGGESPTALLDAALDGSLTSINSTVKSIVPYACRGLSKLKTVNLPDATSIGTYAFYYCTAMTNFSAPKVTSLGSYAFYNSGLKEVNFPLATSVTQNCFYSCNSLKKVDMGAAKSIAQSSFDYCESLETLILRRSEAICTLANATNTLRDTPIAKGTGYIYVPSALIETYKTATNWVNYASQFRAIEDYPDITGG